MMKQLRIFEEDVLGGYLDGEASQLVSMRNRHLGNLLITERSIFYVQILYRLLLFRRDHELEPLYEDIYDAIGPAQSLLIDHDDGYTLEHFRNDMDQLLAWNLVHSRIEKERLRGYKDRLKKKFRYGLTEETISFLNWLELKLQEDFEQRSDDSRDLLEDVCGSLSELLRLLNRYQTANHQDGDARRILYQFVKQDNLCLLINHNMVDFNARLISFIVREYKVEEAQAILKNIDDFIGRYLHQIHSLRNKVIERIAKLQDSKYDTKVTACIHSFEAEQNSIPQLLKSQRVDYRSIPHKLFQFYAEGKKLDLLCSKISDSALNVWRKLYAHLRELERKNNRIEDLRERIIELSQQSDHFCGNLFVSELLALSQMRSDPNYWDDNQKADPPQPKRESQLKEKRPIPYLRSKDKGDGPVKSMEQARLETLKIWFEQKTQHLNSLEKIPLSKGTYDHAEDFSNLMELAKAGLLSKGRKLKTIDYLVTAPMDKLPEIEQSRMAVCVDIDDQSLAFYELMLEKAKQHDRK